MTGEPEPVIRVERLTVRFGEKIACRDVSFVVRPRDVYALLGRERAGKTSLVRSILGEQEPDGGTVRVFGDDPRKKRRRLSKRLGPGRDLLVLDEVAEFPAGGADTTLVASRSPALVRDVATRFGLLKQGRLVLDAAPTDFAERIRRLRYVNRMTETRTSFGNELDEFHAVGVRVRGWGIEAVVADFSNDAFERFRAMDGVQDATAERLTLDEAFEALA